MKKMLETELRGAVMDESKLGTRRPIRRQIEWRVRGRRSRS